jgi:hypothetical protein
VTTRPAVGGYDMVVFGGLPQVIGLAPGTLSVGPNDCDNAAPNSVAYVFDTAVAEPTATHQHAQESVSMVAIMHGFPIAKRAADCMCLDYDGSNPCDHTAPCTYGGPNTPAYDLCHNATTFDPNQTMLTAFGEHP